jgi:hypothetical protein
MIEISASVLDRNMAEVEYASTDVAQHDDQRFTIICSEASVSKMLDLREYTATAFRLAEIAPELTGHGFPLSKCEA